MKYATFLICVLAGFFFLPGVLAYDIWGTVVHHGTVNGISDVYVSYESVVSDNFTSNSPLSYWQMDASSGNTIIDATGDNDGTKYGGSWVDGYSGSAIQFDGLDDYIDLGNPGNLNTEDRKYTVSMWFNTNQTDYWHSDSMIVSGLGDIGYESSPSVFQIGDSWHLISGDVWGTFSGKSWNGSTWFDNASVVSGLPGVGAYSSPTVFLIEAYEGDTLYLITGLDNGSFRGFNWTGSTWQEDSGIVLGLSSVGGDSNPNVFYSNIIDYGLIMIAGNESGGFTGFKLDLDTLIWESYPSVVSGLSDVGYRAFSTYFDMTPGFSGVDDYLIVGEGAGGESQGVFYGFNWTGSQWQSDSTVISGLDASNESGPTPHVFRMGGAYYLISGDWDGQFIGYTMSQVLYSTGLDIDSSGFELTLEGNTVEAHVWDPDISDLHLLTDRGSVFNIFDGQWHHVAYVRGSFDDDNNGTKELYVDGVSIDDQGVSCYQNLTDLDNKYIGASSVGSSRYFNGTIDNVRIYDYALTSDEISDLYASGESVYSSGSTSTSSTGYFSFTGLGSGDYVVNFSKDGYYPKSYTATLPPSLEGLVVDLETDYNGSYPGGTPGTIIVYIVDASGFQVDGEECLAVLVGNGTAVNSQNSSVHVFSGLNESTTYDISAGCVGYPMQNYYNVSTGSVITLYLSIGDEYIVNFNVHDLDGVPYYNTKVDLTGSFFSYGCYTDTYGRCSFTVFGDYYSVKLSGSNHNVYSDVVNVDRDRVGADEFSYALKRLDDTTGLSDGEIKGRMRQDLVLLWSVAVLAVMMFFLRSMGGQK